ncbi:MAG TPA: GNAT family N-acetyltransferase [Thermodesulfobacteriota bacterium]|nr:GNAT family N-acetyltransferase [Thermodesulfobacteriota bacterium]
MRDLNIRRYKPEDAEGIAGLYDKSVREIAIGEYTPEEVEVWASYANEIEEIRHRLAEGLTLVAESGNTPVAFGQLKPINHIAFLYTIKEYSRMGIATEIYKQLEDHALAKGAQYLTTDASRISKPLFERLGFQLECPVIEKRKGVELECFKMKKDLAVKREIQASDPYR